MLEEKTENKCKKCHRTLYDKIHCIFHSSEIRKEKDDFERKFRIEFERQKNEEDKFDFMDFVFPNDISFESEIFEKVVIMHKAIFHGTVNFSFTKFNKKVDFIKVEFKDSTDFSFSVFKNEANFSYGRFYANVNFSNTLFADECILKDIKFSGYVAFDNTHFDKIVDFTDISIIEATKLNFNKTYLNDVEGLFEFIKENREIYSDQLKGTKKQEFLPDSFRLILGESAIAKYPIISRKIKDDIYIMEYQNQYEKNRWGKWWWRFSDYGRSVMRWAIWSLVFALLFGLIFTPPPDWMPDWWIYCCNLFGPEFTFTYENVSKQSPDFFSMMYFSIVTFTTLGFGDIVAVNITARILVTIEVILGYIMLGGLISIMANKLARRS